MGYLPLTWTEIHAWTQLQRIQPKVWELDVLSMLDDAWLEIAHKKNLAPQDLLEDEEAA